VGGRAPEPRAVIGARPGRPWPLGRGGPGSKEKGVLIRGSSENFIGGFRAHPQQGNRREGRHRLGVSPPNGLVSHGPRPGSRPSYVMFTRLGRGRLGYPRELGPEQIERPSEQLRTPAVNKAQEAGHPLSTRPRRPIRSPRHGGELRARAPPGVLTCADPDGAQCMYTDGL
jgi:hypothetical protein